jgi:CHAT domain-containing protein
MAMLALGHFHTEPAFNVCRGVRLWFGESPFFS